MWICSNDTGPKSLLSGVEMFKSFRSTDSIVIILRYVFYYLRSESISAHSVVWSRISNYFPPNFFYNFPCENSHPIAMNTARKLIHLSGAFRENGGRKMREKRKVTTGWAGARRGWKRRDDEFVWHLRTIFDGENFLMRSIIHYMIFCRPLLSPKRAGNFSAFHSSPKCFSTFLPSFLIH